MDNLISRKAAIDALMDEFKRIPTSAIRAKTRIEELPSAQSEPCVDTIDALNESIKHFDDMAKECRINANIEQNDYMDMRDDAAEYRQLSIWLNELKWLRERFQSQPEIIRCKYCNKASKCYGDVIMRSRGGGNIYCPLEFCSEAERRTDDGD